MDSTRKFRHLALLTAGVLAAASLAVGTSASAATPTVAAPRPPTPMSTPAAVADGSAVRLAALPSAQPLRLTLGLASPNAAAEQAYLSEVQTKGSARFHHYLTAAQYIAAFDPSVSSEAAVLSWAQSQGLTVTRRYPDRLLVDVQGTAGTVEKAFGVGLSTYRLRGETDFANDRPPAIPAKLSGVLTNVIGLDNIERVAPGATGAPAATTGASGARAASADPRGTSPAPAYAPGPAFAAGRSAHHDAVPAPRVRPAISGGAIDPTSLNSDQGYSFGALSAQGHCCNPTGNSSGSPAQTSIDLYGFGSVDFDDISAFAGDYGLAYNVGGYNVNGTPPQNDFDDNFEDTLDIEYATATANSHGSYLDTAHVTEFYAADTGVATFADVYNSMYTIGDARTASASYQGYDWAGADMDTVHAVFDNMVGTGWTLLAASGDHGAYGDCSGVSSSYPAGDPDVVAVGGTALAQNSDGTFSSEVAWTPSGTGPCDNNKGGTGGGCNSHFAAPSWQSNLYPCGSGARALPDISLNAATQTPTLVVYAGGSYDAWGTSIASPEMAGFTAQANAYLQAIGDGTAGNYDRLLWGEGFSPSAPHDPFYDITQGCNFVTGESGYCAGTGYDLVTGWGSANMLQLAWMLDWFDSGDYGRPTVSFSGPTTGAWYNSYQEVTWTVADTGGNAAPTGVAGFSQSWDTPDSDPSSEPHQGTGNHFYDGPTFPNATFGFLPLPSAGNGCHTAYVTAWDNMGYSSGPQAYGQLCYDSTTPTGSVSIDGGAAATRNTAVQLTLAARDAVPGDPITSMRLSTDGTHYGSWQNYSTAATYAVPGGDGTKKVYVEYLNAAGTVSAAVSDGIVLDTVAPKVTTAPTITLAKQPLTSGKPSLTVSWAGADSRSGVASYQLQKSIDGGAYSTVTTTSATSATVAVASGHRYVFRVNATDRAGNTSAYSAGSARTLSTVQENGSSITYSAGWSRVAVTGSSGGQLSRSAAAGAKATFRFTGYSVALVTTKSVADGSAKISLDGAAATTVTTHATTGALVQVPYSTSTTTGAHTLVVTNTGTGSSQRFDVDAFLVLS